jgi:activator of HSP90 ATPase
MSQRVNTASDIVAHLEMPEGDQWRSACVQLIARIECELYRRAADIEEYSDESTLRHRLNELVADGVILQTQLKQDDNAQTVTDSCTAQTSNDAAAVSTTANAAEINSGTDAQQNSHSAYDSSSSGTDTSAAVSSDHDAQQQQQQWRLSTAAAAAAQEQQQC